MAQQGRYVTAVIKHGDAKAIKNRRRSNEYHMIKTGRGESYGIRSHDGTNPVRHNVSTFRLKAARTRMAARGESLVGNNSMYGVGKTAAGRAARRKLIASAVVGTAVVGGAAALAVHEIRKHHKPGHAAGTLRRPAKRGHGTRNGAMRHKGGGRRPPVLTTAQRRNMARNRRRGHGGRFA
jgi:hypothetical protein